MSCCVNPKFRSTGHNTHPAIFWDEQEAVGHAGRVGEGPRYSIFGVDCGGEGASRAWDIDRGDSAVGRPQEAVRPDRVEEKPRYRARWVDGLRRGKGGARRIEYGDRPVGRAQVAVPHAAAWVKGLPRDRAGRIDAAGGNRVPRTGARNVDPGKLPVRSPQEAR